MYYLVKMKSPIKMSPHLLSGLSAQIPCPWSFPFVFIVNVSFNGWILIVAFQGLEEICRDKIWKAEKLKGRRQVPQSGDTNTRLWFF